MSTTQVARLYCICLGYVTRDDPAGKREQNFAAYLVQTGDGRNILVDTGFPQGMGIKDPDGAEWPDVVTQLASIGIAPNDIDTLICTHFDFDHCGSNDQFLAATQIVQQRQYNEAAAGYQRYQRGRQYWGNPAIRHELIHGDLELLPGLRLIDTTGHAPGHMSVLVELPEYGKVLLTIDAVPRAALFEYERQDFAMDEDSIDALASTRKLIQLAEDEQVTTVIFGHDGSQWRSLRVLPDFYA